MCDVHYSVFLLWISLDIYEFHATEETAQHVCVFDSVAVLFIVVEVKFLAYVLNITQSFVTHIISYTNVVYFVCILLLKFSMDGDY